MKTRTFTWSETLACIREGAGEDAATEFTAAMETIGSANSAIDQWQAAKKEAVTRAVALVREYVGTDIHFVGPDGVLYHRITGTSVSYPKTGLIEAGVTNEQLLEARMVTPWETIAGVR